MSATDIAAWVGAGAGSLALLWDIFKWLHTGPKLRVSASANMLPYGAMAALVREQESVLVEAANVGDGRTTITHLVAFYYESKLQRLLRRKPTTTMLVPDPSPGKLPAPIDRGERWTGLMEQNAELEKMSNDGYLYVGVLHSSSRKPSVTRLVIHAPEA